MVPDTNFDEVKRVQCVEKKIGAVLCLLKINEEFSVELMVSGYE